MRTSLAVLLAIAVLVSYSGCSDTPVPPTPVTNSPPVIESLTVDVTRVEAEEEAQLTAVVRDAETATGQLTYTWTVAPARGTLVGTGAQVRWRAPKGATTPDQYTFTLTVIERYTSAGVPKTHEVSASVQTRYNDSVPEITNITTTFLNDFGNNSISPEQCVRNFTDSCAIGKADELDDVKDARANFINMGTTLGTPNIIVNNARTFANVFVACEFLSQSRATGIIGTAKGTCRLTAVYESFRWWLCTSNFDSAQGLKPSAIHP